MLATRAGQVGTSWRLLHDICHAQTAGKLDPWNFALMGEIQFSNIYDVGRMLEMLFASTS